MASLVDYEADSSESDVSSEAFSSSSGSHGGFLVNYDSDSSSSSSSSNGSFSSSSSSEEEGPHGSISREHVLYEPGYYNTQAGRLGDIGRPSTAEILRARVAAILAERSPGSPQHQDNLTGESPETNTGSAPTASNVEVHAPLATDISAAGKADKHEEVAIKKTGTVFDNMPNARKSLRMLLRDMDHENGPLSNIQAEPDQQIIKSQDVEEEEEEEEEEEKKTDSNVADISTSEVDESSELREEEEEEEKKTESNVADISTSEVYESSEPRAEIILCLSSISEGPYTGGIENGDGDVFET